MTKSNFEPERDTTTDDEGVQHVSIEKNLHAHIGR